MNHLLQWVERYSTPLLSLLFLLMVATIFHTRGIATEQHLSTVALIDEIEETEKSYNITLLNNQLFIKSNFDALLSTERTYNTQLKALQRTELGLKPEYTEPFQQQLEMVNQLLEQKRKLVDRYKTNRTVHNNSLIYLPVVSQKLESFGQSDRRSEVVATHVLFEEVLIYLGNQDHNTKQALLSAIDALQQQIDQQHGNRNTRLTEANRALQHLNIVITSFSAMNESLKRALSIELGEAIHQLHEIYLNGYKNAQQQNRIGNQLLWVISFILFFGVIRMVRRVREQFKELQQLQTAMDEHAIVSMSDVYGNITYANNKFCEISGYSRQELLGQNHRLIKSERHEPSFYRNLWETISSGKIWQGEVWNCKKGGEEYYCVFGTIVPFSDIHGNITKYVSIRTDLTQLKQSELELQESQEKFQGLVEDIGKGYVIFSIDPEECQIHYISPEFEPLFGIPAKQALNHPLTEVINWSNEERKQLEQCMKHTLEQGRSEPFEITFTHARTGIERTIAITQHSVIKNGSVVAIEGIIQDITERLLAEKRQFEAFQAGVSEMSASILHSIGNIITGLTGTTQKMEQSNRALQKLNQTVRKLSEKLEDESASREDLFKALPLIDRSIDKIANGTDENRGGFSKNINDLKAGLQNISTSINAYRSASEQGANSQSLNLRKLVKDALQLIHNTLEEEQISVDVELPAELEIHAPSNQSMQLLVNLINNSIQAILQRRQGEPDHTGTIMIRGITNASNEIELTLKDNGCGIEQEQRPQLFNHGYTTKPDGSGLGLHTAGNLMNKLGGHIHLTSEGYNRGATATVLFPS